MPKTVEKRPFFGPTAGAGANFLLDNIGFPKDYGQHIFPLETPIEKLNDKIYCDDLKLL